eukprot:1277895-Amphidinium_carterae.1
MAGVWRSRWSEGCIMTESLFKHGCIGPIGYPRASVAAKVDVKVIEKIVIAVMRTMRTSSSARIYCGVFR